MKKQKKIEELLQEILEELEKVNTQLSKQNEHFGVDEYDY